jgi:PhzF family phenazine biosynthesis protein
MDVQRIAAFSHGTNGGNPAGVVLCDALPPADQMLAIAAEVGYSETAPTRSALAPQDLVEAALGLFCYTVADLDPRLPPAIAEAGALHLVLALSSRQTLAAMQNDLERRQRFMIAAGIVTISLVQAETNTLFHARNPFAARGVYEDAATGAAAAALAGYLRDLGWPHGGMIDILRGEDMGMTSRLRAEITSEPGASIRVSGAARQM